MLKTILPALFLCLAFTSQAQYLETFSTPDKGYLLNNMDDFAGVNWNLTAWEAPTNRDDADYFQTTDLGMLECIDLDQEVCWESPLLNTVLAPGMISFSVDLRWAGFDVDFNGDPCTEASLDYIKVQYSVDGGLYQTIPNQVGGAACATIGYAANTPGSPFSDNITITQSNIPGGGSLRIRVCVNVNANAEVVTIDNVTVPEMGVTVGCAAPELNLAVTPITCGGPNSGAIDLTVSGGTPGYTYNWSSGSFQEDLVNIPEGTYTVTVTDAALCTSTASATVGNSPFSISTDIGPATCEGISDGSVDLIISGGLQPYTVNWGDLPGSNDPEDRFFLEAGNYIVTVSDASGCTAETDVIVGIASSDPYSETFDVDGKGILPGSDCPDSLAVNCTNANFAGVNWTIYALDTLDGIDPDDHFHTLGGVLIARDLDQVVCWESPLINAGPTGNVSFSVDLKWEDFDSEPPGPNPPDLVADHIDVEYSCNGGPWVRIDNLIGNGITGHTVVYADGNGNGINGETNISVSNLVCSNLRIRICGHLNSNAETFSIDNVIVDGSSGLYCPLPSLSAAVTDASCFGAADGAIDLSLSGGDPPFTFEWSNGAMTEDISGLTAGTYYVTVTNSFGSKYLEVQVGEPAEIVVVQDLTLSQPISCFGAADGALGVQVQNGQQPYNYLWSDGQTTNPAVNLAVGAYTVTVTDAKGCTGMLGNFLVMQPIAIIASVMVGGNVSCAGAADGSATASALGGTPPYTYAWSNGATTATVTGLAAGTYTVTILDAKACTAVASATVTEPTALTASATATPTTGAMNNGTASAGASGGTPPYYYGWSNGGSTPDITGLPAGTYTVTIEDENGCTATATATVEQQMAAPGDACADGIDINSIFGGPQNTPLTSGLYDNTGYDPGGDPGTGYDCFAEEMGFQLNHTIWFTFTGDGNTYRIKTVQCNATNYINGDGDSQMAAYAGNCTNPTPLACNEDEDANNDIYNAILEIPTQPNVTYLLMVDGWVGSGFPGTGEFCLEVTNLGSSSVTEIGKTNIRVFPNPTTGLVRFNNLDAERIEVFDYTGRLFLQVRQPNGTVDLSGAPAGIYLLKMYAGEAVYSARVVKE